MIFLGFCSPFLMLRLFAMCVVIGFLNLSTVDSRSLEYKVDSLSCFNSPGQKQNLFSLGNYAVTWSQCRKTWVQIPTQLFNNHGSQNKACESWQRCWCVCAKCLFLEKNEKKKAPDTQSPTEIIPLPISLPSFLTRMDMGCPLLYSLSLEKYSSKFNNLGRFSFVSIKESLDLKEEKFTTLHF